MPIAGPLQLDITNDVAVIRARPGCAPLVGVTMISMASLLVFVLLGGFESLDQDVWLTYAWAWAIGTGLFFGFLLALHISRYPVARFNRLNRTARIFRWQPLRSTRTVAWEQIAAIATTAHTSKYGDPEFGLSLVLKSGDKVPLTQRTYPDGRACDDLSRALNRFILEA
jgi:hypothetical protein